MKQMKQDFQLIIYKSKSYKKSVKQNETRHHAEKVTQTLKTFLLLINKTLL